MYEVNGYSNVFHTGRNRFCFKYINVVLAVFIYWCRFERVLWHDNEEGTILKVHASLGTSKDTVNFTVSGMESNTFLLFVLQSTATPWTRAWVW